MSLLRLPQKKLFWLNATLFVPAVISTVKAVRNGVNPARSQDFQWSGAHLFASGIDPYRIYLLGNPGHLILKTQIPNYLQELYVLLWPLGILPEHSGAVLWVGFNLLFAVASVWMLARHFGLERAQALLLGLMLAMSTPFRVSVGNGQQSLLELLLFVLALTGTAISAPALGLSFFKYSFAPIMFFYASLRNTRRAALSLVLPLAGWLIFWLHLHGSLLTSAIEPVEVGRSGVAPGTADLVSFCMWFAPRLQSLAIVATALLSACIAFLVSKRCLSPLKSSATIAACSLFLFPHLIYDFVLLAIPGAFLLSSERPSRTTTAFCLLSIGGLAYIVPAFFGAQSAAFHLAINLVLLLGLMGMLLFSPENPRKIPSAPLDSERDGCKNVVR